MSDEKSQEVTIAVLGERIENLQDDLRKSIPELKEAIDGLRTELTKKTEPVANRVTALEYASARVGGALKLAGFLIGIFASGAVAWASWVTVTTMSTEQTVVHIRDEVRRIDATKNTAASGRPQE